MIVCEGRSNEMKKSIAIVLLGSALMLPNNQSAEASYSNNEVNAIQAKTVHYLNLEGQKKHLNYNELRFFLNSYLQDWMKQNGQHIVPVKPKPVKPAPVQPSEPVVKPTPIQPSKPVVKPTPIQPSKPIVKPTPIQPSKPVEKPKPNTPSEPIVKPTPIEPSKPVQKPVESKPVETPTNATMSDVEKQVLNLTNVERQKAGLKPLQIDTKLQNSARQKSNDMATNRYFSHTSPTYGSPFDQMKANGITYRAAAENIAMGQRTAEEVVKAWMESPGHRQNILTPGYTHIGIGHDKNGNYWTQQFIQK